MSSSQRSLLRTAAFLFALLFTTAAVTQYLFLRWKLYDETKSGLLDDAEAMRGQIGIIDTWNLQAYRRASDTTPDVYLVIAQNGTLIDTHGYLRTMITHVSLPFASEYDHPFRFSSDLGEDWNLYVHKLRDGIVVLGARKEITPEGVETLFVSNAARSGASITDALGTQERAIDENFDYAIIDKDGTLRYAIGGIPLKASPPDIPPSPILLPVTGIEGKMYEAFLDPVVSKSHGSVGLISVYVDVTSDQRVLRQSAFFNVAVAALLWLVTVAVSGTYLTRLRGSSISCAQIPSLDEGEAVEFKSSLRWDYKNQKASRAVERAVAKTVVGFLNSENGGSLIIGMSDAKKVLGLEADYATFDTIKPDRDGFEQVLHGILIKAIGENLCTRYVKTRFCSLQGKELCITDVAPSSAPVFLEEEGSRPRQLYVRVGNSTRPFGVQEALAYAQGRWAAGLVLSRPHSS